MFLLVSGASGAGKSTARRLVAGELEPEVECVELHDVAPMPRVPTLAWRQRATEAVACHALKLQEDGRHLLLAGDPVAAGEVLAAPSAERLDGIAVCLLDVARDPQAARLVARGDDPTLLVHHVAFAGWMREHATDPHHRPEVLQTDGWQQMRWERLRRLDETGSWAMHVLDTSSLTPAAVATELLAWCRRALAGQAPSMHVRP
jgi:energy-coupling factor transporter ATP-binding protein EcfA2